MMMKYSRILVLLLFVSCNDSDHKDPKGTKDEYTCPMHPEIIKDQPGQCPVCGMDLVKRTNAEAPKVYTCPMHPEIIRNQPGACPVCGMDLVEKHTEGAGIQDTSLQFLLKPTNQFVISKIKTVALVQKEVRVEIKASGTITYDTRLGNTISSRVAGRIEKLYVKYRFQPVNKGDKLMDIYSEELVTEQHNYIYILKNDPGNEAIITASETKLNLLGFTKEQIQNLRATRKVQQSVTVYSPYSGHLHDQKPAQSDDNMNAGQMTQQQLTIQEGMYVQKGQTVFNVYSTDKVWAIINVSAERQSMLKKGFPVKLYVDGVKDTLMGKVDFVEPLMRSEQKLITARVYLDNTGFRLKTGAIVQAVIQPEKETGYFLPSSAVVNLGTRNAVFVMRENLFEAIEVQLGLKSDGWVQITSGLKNSDIVSENAQLLVDSEAFVKTTMK
jgi:membrane fusion protein, copper/silver efflux system